MDTSLEVQKYAALHNLSAKNAKELEEKYRAALDAVKGLSTPRELRTAFGLTTDFTAEEKATLRRDNAWAFDDDVDNAAPPEA